MHVKPGLRVFTCCCLRSECWAIVTSVGLCPDCKFVLLIFAEASIGEEYLQELVSTKSMPSCFVHYRTTHLPQVASSLLRRSDSCGTVREANADWLIDIEPENIVYMMLNDLWWATHTLATLFHEFGLRLTVWLLLLMRHGPFSWKRPIILELPGWKTMKSALVKSNERSTYASVEPYGKRCGVRVAARRKEPEPKRPGGQGRSANDGSHAIRTTCSPTKSNLRTLMLDKRPALSRILHCSRQPAVFQESSLRGSQQPLHGTVGLSRLLHGCPPLLVFGQRAPGKLQI